MRFRLEILGTDALSMVGLACGQGASESGSSTSTAGSSQADGSSARVSSSGSSGSQSSSTSEVALAAVRAPPAPPERLAVPRQLAPAPVPPARAAQVRGASPRLATFTKAPIRRASQRTARFARSMVHTQPRLLSSPACVGQHHQGRSSPCRGRLRRHVGTDVVLYGHNVHHLGHLRPIAAG